MVSVTEGIRSSVLLHLEASDLPPASADCARMGLTLSILAHAPDGSFRAAIHTPDLTVAWAKAWAESDHDAIGRMLGFPDCCRAFFARAWASTDARDVTPAMSDIDGPWEANTMLRWIGVRLVPHLPCSASCEKTIENARAYVAMGARLGINVLSLETLLRLPVQHDSLNGVLIVSTPHFRFMAGANPERSFASRPASPEQIEFHSDAGPEGPATWIDNGFGSRETMEHAHSLVRAVVGDVRSALDLGCGDGRLLATIANGRVGGPWQGIESDAGRAERGNRRYGPRVRVIVGKIQDLLLWWPGEPDVTLLMPGRLLEMTPDDARKVRRALRGRLVLYAYGDWLTKYGGLEVLAELAGLRLITAGVSSGGASAAEGVVR